MYELRSIGEEEYEGFHRRLSSAFGEDSTEEARAYERHTFEFDRSIVAIDGGELVGTAGAFSFELTVPGPAVVSVAGVSWVGVLPTHRRRGVLRAMMDHQLDDVVARGEAIAVLTASEAGIYGRFGYGVATRAATVDIAASGAELRSPSTGRGRIRLLDAPAAGKVLPGVHDAYRRSRPGAINRSEDTWAAYLSDPKDWRAGASGRFYAVHEADDGVADGYAAYRVKPSESGEETGKTVIVSEVHTAGPDAGSRSRAAACEIEAALFEYLLAIDLQRTLRLARRPLDDPLRWRLVDSRRYCTTKVADWLWARLLDIPAALAARRYAVAGKLVVAVHDAFRPVNDGRYLLDGGPDGATVTRLDGTGPSPDVSLPVDALGAAYLGGVPFTILAAAGLVSGERDALARADAMFVSTPLPYCDEPF